MDGQEQLSMFPPSRNPDAKLREVKMSSTKKSIWFNLLDLTERAGATFAQAFLATITVDATGITQIDALKVGAVAGGYAVAKFLMVKVNEYLKNGSKMEVTVTNFVK